MNLSHSQTYESRIGFLSGRWVPHGEMRLGVDDVGFRQGVTAVERLRTYQGRIFAIEAHLRRWQWSTSKLGIGPLPSMEAYEAYLRELLATQSSRSWSGKVISASRCLPRQAWVVDRLQRSDCISIDSITKRSTCTVNGARPSS